LPFSENDSNYGTTLAFTRTERKVAPVDSDLSAKLETTYSDANPKETIHD